MAKNSIPEFSETPSQNTDIGGISLLGTASPRVIKDYMPELMAQLADMNAGTSPLDDTFTLRDPTDTTKHFRIDGESIPTGTVRVIDGEELYQLLLRGTKPRVVTAYTVSGTHTFNTATKYFQIIAVAAGGGSGGVDGQGTGTGAASAGGNSGFFGETAFLAKGVLTTGTIVIGTAGTAGASSAGDGGDGGDTTWNDATNGTLTWKGGKGSGGATGTTAHFFGTPVANGASSGALTGSYTPGGPGITNGFLDAGGQGASTPWGTGGISVAVGGASAAGVVGTGYGVGGSGAASAGVTTNVAGAAGTGGRLEVREY